MEPIQAPIVKKVEVGQVEAYLNDPTKLVVVQTAPAVRVSLGEFFGMPVGTVVTGKMVASLKALGFKAVFDTDLGADITIWEEAMEFLKKVQNNGPYPLFNSCCIGWLMQARNNYSDLIPLISTAKSPVGMLGSVVKTYYAQKANWDPKDIVVVSVVPCILKKQEAQLPFNTTNGLYDVDISLTTKDLAGMIAEKKLDFASLPDQPFDNPLGESTGGGTIFGRSGGVLEAAIRTAYYWYDKTIDPKPLDFKVSSLSSDIMEAPIHLAGKDLWVAHTGLIGVKKIAQLIRADLCPYAFVEVMACPGGCIMGAGQPIHLPKEGIDNRQIRELRRQALNGIDQKQPRRVSALNPDVNRVYNILFDSKAGSEKAEVQLHRSYNK
ncbi:MAG: iron hydrogenase small subunit [Bacilli bacterium]|jgi:iron-only hydrogenase group A|nr:iron hydrogenase small subunit [Bacilli bacterium]